MQDIKREIWEYLTVFQMLKNMLVNAGMDRIQ